MRLYIFKSLNFPKVFSIQFRNRCSIHYLEPNNNFLLKLYVKVVEKIYRHKFIRIKMGKLRDNKNQLLFNEAIKKTVIDIQEERKKIFNNSGNKTLNIFHEEYVKQLWYEKMPYNLIYFYGELKKNELDQNTDILYIERFSINNFYRLKRDISKIFIIEFLRIVVLFSKLFSRLYKKNHSIENLISTDNLILSSEPYPESEDSLYLRNQKVVSEIISKGNSYIVIDLKLNKIYSKNEDYIFKRSSVFEFFSSFDYKLPNIINYNGIEYNFKITKIIRYIFQTFLIWNLAKNIKHRRIIISGNSFEASPFILVSHLLNKPIFMYQWSILGKMNPWLQSPYVGVMGFTKKHIYEYLNFNKSLNFFINKSERIEYPFTSLLNNKKIKEFNKFLKNNFDFSVAYFEDSFCRDNVKIDSFGCYFYEDAKKEILYLLKLAQKNPKLAIVFKSQHCDRTLSKLISNDSDLSELYNPKQVFDISSPTYLNNRNIVTPQEIGKCVDISITSTIGGTAGYEILASSSRNIFIKCGYSIYDDLLPENLIIESISELGLLLENFKFNRKNLIESNVGKIDFTLLKNKL